MLCHLHLQTAIVYSAGGALIYEIDIGVGQQFLQPGASGERKIWNNIYIWGHWVRHLILVQIIGALDKNVTLDL